jgi:hypothetical protein
MYSSASINRDTAIKFLSERIGDFSNDEIEDILNYLLTHRLSVLFSVIPDGKCYPDIQNNILTEITGKVKSVYPQEDELSI